MDTKHMSYIVIVEPMINLESQHMTINLVLSKKYKL